MADRRPNPLVVFENLNAYQRTGALKAAVELDLFTRISEGQRTVDALAAQIGAPARGVRILCDYMVIIGLLEKQSDAYSLTVDSAAYLVRSAPGYLGGTTKFLLDPGYAAAFGDLASIIRSGRTSLPDQGTMSPEHPIWMEFARAMVPMAEAAAIEIASLLELNGPAEVLDIAAGHGMFGIHIAREHPPARITALDWPNVLTVAQENAARLGVADRYSLLPGSAFDVAFAGPYDLVLATNFFHHFDRPTCEMLMRKIHAALKPGGRCLTLEFVPDENRVAPPAPASFALLMLATTVAGDAYTFSEYDAMFRSAGFGPSTIQPLTKKPQSILITVRES